MCPADLSCLTDLSHLTRCAVYTRTSSDEESTQEFGSIEAQRDAGLAYIASQRHAGWYAANRAYDDPGYSGGAMDRPGLRQLRSDIEAGLIRIVVVHKIDRLSRSLVDFTTLMAFFKQHNVALVAVTQHLNTRDATGNLAINMLMSFAQFERELSGDRIRDKIRATRRKGLWMISAPPPGLPHSHIIMA
jgi:DNA invertase Pin-like site-specific DNA recombinase